MPRALLLGRLPLWPEAENQNRLSGYLRRLGLLVDEVGTVDEATHHLTQGAYAFLVMSLFTTEKDDGFHLLQWVYLRSKKIPIIIVDEGVFFTANRTRLKNYRNIVGMLTPAECGGDMFPLLEIIKKLIVVKLPPKGGTEGESGEGEGENPNGLGPMLRWLFGGVGLLGLVWLGILVRSQEPSGDRTMTGVLVFLVSLACLFAVYGPFADKALRVFQDVWKRVKGSDDS